MALIKGIRNLSAAPNQQQRNYVPCLIPAGNRVSQGFAVTSKHSLGIAPYICGAGSSISLLHFLFKSNAETRSGDFPVLKESINSVLSRRDYRFQFT